MVIVLVDGAIYFGHHVICNLIKIPTTSYVNATLKRRVHGFLRIRGGEEIFKPFGHWGKSKWKRENPSKYQLPILDLVPNHLNLPKIGWVSYCMRMGKVWES